MKTMTEAIRIFVVDDHALFCQGVMLLLDDDPVFLIPVSAGSLDE